MTDAARMFQPLSAEETAAVEVVACIAEHRLPARRKPDAVFAQIPAPERLGFGSDLKVERCLTLFLMVPLDFGFTPGVVFAFALDLALALDVETFGYVHSRSMREKAEAGHGGRDR